MLRSCLALAQYTYHCVRLTKRLRCQIHVREMSALGTEHSIHSRRCLGADSGPNLMIVGPTGDEVRAAVTGGRSSVLESET